MSCSKAFGIGFRFEITSNEHIKHILSKVNKSIGLLRKFQPVVPRSSLLTIYKIFICSHFDYTNVVYDQSYKSSFHKKLELIQYNAALAVTGAIWGSSSQNIYQEIGLESLQSRHWVRKLCQFYKILNHLDIFLLLFQLKKEFTIPGIVIIFLYLKSSIITLETLFFPLH